MTVGEIIPVNASTLIEFDQPYGSIVDSTDAGLPRVELGHKLSR